MDAEQLADDEVRRLARDLLLRSEIIAAQITERVLPVAPELAPTGTADAVLLEDPLQRAAPPPSALVRSGRTGQGVSNASRFS